MMYERWREVAAARQDELALYDAGSGRRWTFGQLALQTEVVPLSSQALAFPKGTTAEFVFTVLQAWRAGHVVVPLEAEQTPLVFTALPHGIVHVKTTSATTGAPRALLFTASQLIADAANIVQTMGLRADWPNLGVISLAHSYGFSNLVLPLLLHGIPLVLLESPLPEAVRRCASLFQDITLPAVPILWRAWHEAGAIPKNVRLAISAGASLPLALEHEIFQTSGLKLHNFYGASECGGIAYDSTAVPRTDAACVGTPLQNVALSISEDHCLEVRSAAVAETYWSQPEANLAGGCYRTSDLAEIIGGQIFLRGRATDQINVAGRKVSPDGIERVLLEHPLVSGCLVFGAPSPDDGRPEIIVAAVVAHAPVSGEALKQFLLARLPAWQVPREWWFVDSLTANTRGKLSRAEWRRRCRAERSGGVMK